jgi:peroxisomal enoyl-CoA hydratase 2
MSAKDQVQPDKVRGTVLAEGTQDFDKMKCILYHLGIGFAKDPMNESHFKFSYENDDDFTVFPTMPVLSLASALDSLFSIPGMPQFNPMMLLHGEQSVINYKPIPVGEVLKTKAVATDIADKVKGALLTVTISLTDDSDVKYADAIFKFFVRGIGGFGDKGKDTSVLPKVPDREPDNVAEEPTADNLALLY